MQYMQKMKKINFGGLLNIIHACILNISHNKTKSALMLKLYIYTEFVINLTCCSCCMYSHCIAYV